MLASKIWAVSFLLIGSVAPTLKASAESVVVEPVPADSRGGILPSKWSDCSDDSQCVLIPYGCSEFASAHFKFERQATEKAYKVGGDPRTLNCLSPRAGKDGGPLEALCRGKQCGVFSFPACVDASCKKKHPHCEIVTKFSIDPGDKDLGSRVREMVWGPTKESCQARCLRSSRTLQSRVKASEQSQYELDCQFVGRSIQRHVVKGTLLGRGF